MTPQDKINLLESNNKMLENKVSSLERDLEHYRTSNSKLLALLENASNAKTDKETIDYLNALILSFELNRDVSPETNAQIADNHLSPRILLMSPTDIMILAAKCTQIATRCNIIMSRDGRKAKLADEDKMRIKAANKKATEPPPKQGRIALTPEEKAMRGTIRSIAFVKSNKGWTQILDDDQIINLIKSQPTFAMSTHDAILKTVSSVRNELK